jgi:dTDP-4-dehydrorhamnose 3,5-epimerase
MFLQDLEIPGAVLVRLDRKQDARGFFARTFCVNEFAAAGLATAAVQASVSYNERRGTVRGMHFQWPPSREDKLVRCVRGSVFDVLLDLRPDSPTYLQHRALALDEDNRDAVFIPHGVAHGFQTLADRTEVLYQMTDFFAPEINAGVRWDDPAFAISWPLSEIVISERDAACADFDRAAFESELRRRAAHAGKPS